VSKGMSGRRVDDVDAGFFDAADVEGVGVDELHDYYAEDVFVGEGVGVTQLCCAGETMSLTSFGMTCGRSG